MRLPRTAPNFHCWSMSDGYTLRGRVWPSRSRTPHLACLYLHGIQSHGGWFEWSASLLAEHMGPVVLPDRRGSGLNQAARGDTPGVERWLQDIDELAAWTTAEFGVRRFGLVGVSWGGKLAAMWARRQKQRVARLLLVAPGLFPAVDLSLRAKLNVAWALVGGGTRRFARYCLAMGRRGVGHYEPTADTDAGRYLFDIPLNDPALFTDNPAGRRFIAEDPLKLTKVTARFLWCSRQLDRTIGRWKRGALEVPINLLLADRDRIIRNLSTEAWARRVGAGGVFVRVFPHAAHTLEFESPADELADELIRWATGTVA